MSRRWCACLGCCCTRSSPGSLAPWFPGSLVPWFPGKHWPPWYIVTRRYKLL